MSVMPRLQAGRNAASNPPPPSTPEKAPPPAATFMGLRSAVIGDQVTAGYRVARLVQAANCSTDIRVRPCVRGTTAGEVLHNSNEGCSLTVVSWCKLGNPGIP